MGTEISQVENIMDIMHDANITDGMFPTRWSISKAIPLNGQLKHKISVAFLIVVLFQINFPLVPSLIVHMNIF